MNSQNKIIDEFTGLNVSQQRKHQLRQRKLGSKRKLARYSRMHSVGAMKLVFRHWLDRQAACLPR